MLNKNVCPNCGQLYDTDLERCPLCGTPAQVLETERPVQRRRITEQERRQRVNDRKAAEREERRRRKDELLARDAEEERLLEEEERARREAKQKKKAEKRERKEREKIEREQQEMRERNAQEQRERMARPHPLEQAEPTDRALPYVTVPTRVQQSDRGRVPRAFLVMSTLLLAITLIVGGTYLLWKTGVMNISFYDKLVARRDEKPAAQPVETQPPATQATEPSGTQSTDVPVPRAECTGLVLDINELSFTSAGDSKQISVIVEPEGCTQKVAFSTGDDTVAKVGSTGVVTSIGEGSTVITVTCGGITAECKVTCAFPTEPPKPTEPFDGNLEFKTDDITFFEPGENFVLILKDLPADTAVIWTSDDENIATVDDGGHVVAVGKGTTKINAEVGGKKVSCIVRCNFKEG